MARKSVGFVELEWECPSCGNRNPGPARTCIQCGAAHPDSADFVQAAEEKILTDPAAIAAATAGPDIHCAYCGTRNPAGAKVCKQCGGDLGEGAARSKGKVLGAHRSEPAPTVTCPSCGAESPAGALKCRQCGAPLAPVPATEPTPAASAHRRPIWPFLVAGAAIILIAILVLGGRTKELVGEVSAVYWQRSIAVEALMPVTKETWRTDVPAGVPIGSCVSRLHHTQDEPEAGAREVCGTAYTEDQGSGYGEVVQDCRYEVYADWCKYEAEEWQRVDLIVAEGADLAPRWPALSLTTDQREGSRSEVMKVTFDTDGNVYDYSVRDANSFQEFAPGSRWLLTVNGFGSITDVKAK